MHLKSLILTLLPLLAAAQDPIPAAATTPAVATTASGTATRSTVTQTATTTLVKTMTLSKVHTVTSVCNTTMSATHMSTAVGTTSYYTTSSVAVVKPTLMPSKVPDNAGGSLAARGVVVAGVAALAAVLM